MKRVLLSTLFTLTIGVLAITPVMAAEQGGGYYVTSVKTNEGDGFYALSQISSQNQAVLVAMTPEELASVEGGLLGGLLIQLGLVLEDLADKVKTVPLVGGLLCTLLNGTSGCQSS